MAPYTPENNPMIRGDPYSYDLNWVVNQIKGWKDPADSADRAKASEEAAAASAEAADLSAQAAADSEDAAKNYADHIADPVAGLVTEWLDDHITQPTTPAIDTSLSVIGAAADAGSVGARALLSNTEVITSANVSNYPDANTLVGNRIYGISSDVTSAMMANLPVYGVSGKLVYYLHDGVTRAGFQTYTTETDFWWRTVTTSDFKAWQKFSSAEVFAKMGLQSNIEAITSANVNNYPDANTLVGNRIYGVSSDVTSAMMANLPVYGVSGKLVYYLHDGVTRAGFQTYTTETDFWWRTSTTSAFRDWKRLSADYPSFNENNQYFIKTCIDKSMIQLNANSKIAIFGDSITTTSHGGFTWASVLASKIGCAADSYGVGGAAFVYAADPALQIATQITSANIGDANLIIVAGGTNDAAYNSDPAEIKTAVGNIITQIRTITNAPIIFITPIYRAQVKQNARLLPIGAAIANVALSNDCSVISGFDFPISCFATDYMDELTDGDGLHPGPIGKRIYAQAVINALL